MQHRTHADFIAAHWGWDNAFSGWTEELSTKYGMPNQNPDFWASYSPKTCLADLSGPLALRDSDSDDVVPEAWPVTLAEELEAVDSQPWAWHVNTADHHRISINPGVAMLGTVVFFGTHVKGESERE